MCVFDIDMSSEQMDLEGLSEQLNEIRNAILKVELEYGEVISSVHPNYQYNALNFLRYLRLRTFDLREIQWSLSALGLSSLSHSERHVLANIENILYLLNAQLGKEFRGKYEFGKHPVNFIESANRLNENTQRLFGKHIGQMGVMVTLPTQATDIEYVRMLVRSGMNIARINCSHDDSEVWEQMVENLRQVGVEESRLCSIYFDLAGPKIRTDELYRVKKGKWEKEKSLKLESGDLIFLMKEKNKSILREVEIKKQKIVTCTLPAIIDDAKIQQSIWFDDGKIGGVIEDKWPDVLQVRITKSAPTGSKLKPEKGINLPETHLNLPSLTDEDIHNLDFIAEHADIVGFSFVRRVEDVAMLQEELANRGRHDLGIVLKIENQEAFSNLPGLILQGMKSESLGIMTARGDLAVELGAERLSEVQEQIMWLCEAALIPNIWATQVLESLAKTGTSSRAEITDAAMSVRTECVMLNKGPYIDLALKTLTDILSRMEKHQHKKQATLRKLNVAEDFIESLPVAGAI